MITKHCCREFEKAVDSDDFCYFKANEDAYHSITKDGWYIRNSEFNRPIASLEPFKYCPWCSKELRRNEGI